MIKHHGLPKLMTRKMSEMELNARMMSWDSLRLPGHFRSIPGVVNAGNEIERAP
jgi:hypothetical protein